MALLPFQAKTTGRFPVKITKASIVQPDQQLTPASGSEITCRCSDRGWATKTDTWCSSVLLYGQAHFLEKAGVSRIPM